MRQGTFLNVRGLPIIGKTKAINKKEKKQTNNINNIGNANQDLEEIDHSISQVSTTLTETVVIYIMKKYFIV